jgi:hypothetical protein
MIISSTIRKELNKICEFIFENEQLFLKQFIDVEGELISVSINDETIHFVIVTDDGQHIASNCKVDHFNDLVFRIDNG